MVTKTQHGYFVLADISGFTAFMAGTELDHSQAIIAELLELIIARFAPLLTLSKLEGDCVFAYAPAERVTRGETFVELLETTYLAFRDCVAVAHRRTTCTCAACRAIPMLDLKFMVHYGEFVRQTVAGREEIVGSDVNLVHRLLKNHVVEQSGWKAYALFTDKTLQALRIQPEGLFPYAETYDIWAQCRRVA